MIHHISAEYLTVDRVREILENNIKIDLSEDAKKRIVRCREYLDNKMETQKEPIYGITTGFGSLCNISIDKDQLSQLQKNLVMSHACGTGERVPAEIVKLMLLLKIQSLSYGNSGVQLETVQRLVDFFNNDVLPVVFQQGSLGASGDLAPLPSDQYRYGQYLVANIFWNVNANLQVGAEYLRGWRTDFNDMTRHATRLEPSRMIRAARGPPISVSTASTVKPMDWSVRNRAPII